VHVVQHVHQSDVLVSMTVRQYLYVIGHFSHLTNDLLTFSV
jgi:hypothetical protein